MQRQCFVDPWYILFFNYRYFHYFDPLASLKDAGYEAKAITSNFRLNTSFKLLDMCCGYGRHLKEFTKLGFKNLTGVDLSKTLINIAKQRANGRVNYIHDDARTVELPREKFDFVCILGTSLGLHADEKPDIEILKKAMEVLKPGGKILIEQYNTRPPNLDVRESGVIDGVRIEFERSAIFTENRIFTGYCRYYYPNFEKEDILWFRARMYTQEGFMQILRKIGFKNIEIFGNFDFKPYNEKDSPLILLFAEK